jgi:hypothetical protein
MNRRASFLKRNKMRSEPANATQAQSSSCFRCLLVKTATGSASAQPAGGITAQEGYRDTREVPIVHVGVRSRLPGCGKR